MTPSFTTPHHAKFPRKRRQNSLFHASFRIDEDMDQTDKGRNEQDD